MGSDLGDLRRWFVFGRHPMSGNVDVSNGDEDVLTDVGSALAAQIVAARNAHVDRLLGLPRVPS